MSRTHPKRVTFDETFTYSSESNEINTIVGESEPLKRFQEFTYEAGE